MDKVNIYTLNGQRSPRPYPGVGIYILEYMTSKGPATVTGVLDITASKNEYEVSLLIEALERIKKPCELEIYVGDNYISQLVESGQMDKWASHGWVTARGTPVKNKIALELLRNLLQKHNVNFHMEKHSYSSWMESELERRRNEKDLHFRANNRHSGLPGAVQKGGKAAD